jgi:hypothetical protein
VQRVRQDGREPGRLAREQESVLGERIEDHHLPTLWIEARQLRPGHIIMTA